MKKYLKIIFLIIVAAVGIKIFLFLKKDKEYRITVKIATEQKSAAIRAEFLRKKRFKEECRKIWHSEGRVPVFGGGWVDIKKIPYDFLMIQDDDNGECWVTRITGKYYWTGEGIIPKHAEFSGMYNSSESEHKKTYIQIYPAEGWKEFHISIEFYNYQKMALCKALGEEYYYAHTSPPNCQKKCEFDEFEIKKDKCINPGKKPSYKHPSSQLIKTAYHPDFDFVLNTNRDFFMYYKLRTWPFEESEPIPPLRVHILSDSLKMKTDFANWTNEELSEFIPSSKKFTSDLYFYFKYSRVTHFSGQVELSEAQHFFMNLREYLMEIYIKD